MTCHLSIMTILLVVFRPLHSLEIRDVLFTRTANISAASFSMFLKKSTTAATVLHCSEECNYFEARTGRVCNAFRFTAGGNNCDMAYVEYLEDPDNGDPGEDIFVESSQIPLLPMVCRGSDHCCARAHRDLCGEGDGDCNNDNECSGSLVCGNNNCLSFHSEGGRWGAEDDCCERQCTPEHPCVEGGGTCLSDTDCQNPGWLKCGQNCLDQKYFPRDEYFQNSETFNFNSSDKCCYRPCNKDYNVCGENQVGCLNDDDCSPGLICRTDVAQPFCADVDECALLICGSESFGNSTCVNTIGSYNCTCNSGFSNLVLYDGCSDVNECDTGGACPPGIDCVNLEGSFSCTYKAVRGTYVTYSISKTWSDAKAYCESNGMTMASIINSDENILLSSLSSSQMWVGATDELEEGVWRWPNGYIATYFSWASNQPNGRTSQNCMTTNYLSDEKWNDWSCTNSYYFACMILN